MTPKVIDKEKKKREIVMAAMKVFAQKGAKNSRMADIAASAKIGKGTIYEYFRSRDEILMEAFCLVMGDMEAKLKSVLKKTQNPSEKLGSMMRVTYDTLSQLTTDIIEIFIDFWSEGIRHKDAGESSAFNLKGMYVNYRRQITQVLNQGIEKGHFRKMDTTAVASVLMAIIDGLLLQMILDRGAFDHSSVIDETMIMVLNGIKNKET